VYVDVQNYGCGSISRTFGVLVSGCIHKHVNCKLKLFLCTSCKVIFDPRIHDTHLLYLLSLNIGLKVI
jgi:hypothetical protein